MNVMYGKLFLSLMHWMLIRPIDR